MTNIISSRVFISMAVYTAILTSFVLAGFFIPVERADAQTANLLTNSSFEQAGENSKVAAGWQAFGNGYTRVNNGQDGSWSIKLTNNSNNQQSGASQRIDLQQDKVKPVLLTAYVKGSNIKNYAGGYFGASLYAEIHLQDGSVAYWNSLGNYGSFNWRKIGFNTGTLPAVNQPIDHIFVVPILASAKGTANFDNLMVSEYQPADAAVTLMFDDGELTTFSEGLPILQPFGYQGSAAIFTQAVGEEGYMNWQQVQALQKEGWEIVSHGLTHTDLTTLSEKDIKEELSKSKRKLENKGLIVNNFALPYGTYNSNIIALGAKWYRSLRAYEQGSNPAGAVPWEIKVRGLTATTTADEVANWISAAQAKGEWLVIVFHSIAETGDDVYHTAPDTLAAIAQVVRDSGVEVVTYDGGLQKFAAL